jgi:hypothetical protein
MRKSSHQQWDPSVQITGVDIPFFDLVLLLVKFALAAIPATIVLTGIVMLIAALVFNAVPAR